MYILNEQNMSGKNIFNIKTLFKCLLVTYIFTSVFVVFWLQSECFNRTKDIGKTNIRSERNLTSILNLKNASDITYVYRNITSIVYVNKTVEKIVYGKRNNDDFRYGPGENGKKVVKVEYDKNKINITKLEQLKVFHGFDTIMSDTISLQRRVPDKRHPNCLKIEYPSDMPPVSVVIIFRDEWHSILLRTAYSVLQMSPPHLLTEVILVDDGSTDPDLVAKVDLHVANVEKLKLVRNKESLGLMMARQKGIDATTSDYFIVMDGHMEVGPGWLEPLIYRLVQEPNALLCSHIGAIRYEDFEYYIDDENYGSFDAQFPFFDFLTLDQMWATFSPEFRSDRNKSIAPLPYGTIQGMMAAMRKGFFYQLGGFDPGMKVWGSEQMELSIKVWCCGGRVEMIPCSKVAHMYRLTPWGKPDTAPERDTNKVRTIEVWLDPPYRDFIYDTIRGANFTTGNLADRYRIRRENNCKSYQHFIDTVKQFSNVYMPETVTYKGAIFNEAYKVCMDKAEINKTEKLILYNCHGKYNQYFVLTEYNEIRTVQGSVVKVARRENSTYIEITHSPSPITDDAVKWIYENGRIHYFGTNLCLEAMNRTNVALRHCSSEEYMPQQWIWGYKIKS